MNDICPKCGKATVERYPNDKSLGVCLNRTCGWKEKLSDKPHCVVCFGEVVEDFIFVRDGIAHKAVRGFYCRDCGIEYKFIPKEETLREINNRIVNRR
jgi:hypothetical protein